MKSKKDPLLKARDYCFCLLKFRARSEAEIYKRLKQKGFSEEIIKKTINYLKEKKFLNDEEFCSEWISSRIKKKLGLFRIKQELKQKGIKPEIIDKQIQQIKENYSEDKIISEIIKEKIEKSKQEDPRKLKAKIFGYLLRRGFNAELAEDLLNQYINDE